jgi:hypothetical protein
MVSNLAMQAYRKQILLNFSLGLSGRCHQAPAKASSSTPPRYLSTPPNENMKIRLCFKTLPEIEQTFLIFFGYLLKNM